MFLNQKAICLALLTLVVLVGIFSFQNFTQAWEFPNGENLPGNYMFNAPDGKYYKYQYIEGSATEYSSGSYMWTEVNADGSPLTAQQQDQRLEQYRLNQTIADINQYKPTLKVCIGGACDIFESITCTVGDKCPIPWLTKYVGIVYQYGVALAAVLATIMIMIGGFLWLTSAGSPDRVGKAKDFIVSAFTGLLLALFSFMILYTVNPELTKLTPISVQTAAPMTPPPIVEAAPAYPAGQAPAPLAATTINQSEIAKQLSEHGVTSKPGVDYNGFPQYGIDRLEAYGDIFPGLQVNSAVRGVNETRHKPEYPVVDIHFEEGDALYNSITTNAVAPPQIIPGWGTAYYMADGSMWVDEPPGSVNNNNPRHWHTEFWPVEQHHREAGFKP